MIPSIEYLRGHEAYRIVAGIGDHVGRPGRVGGAVLAAPLGRCGRSPPTPARGRRTRCCACCASSGSASTRSSCRWRRNRRRCCGGATPRSLIGDPALFLDHAGGWASQKIDLGERVDLADGVAVRVGVLGRAPGVAVRRRSRALSAARDAGVAASDAIAAAYCGPERAALGQAYLRDNIRYTLGEREEAGLRRYYELAERTTVVAAAVGRDAVFLSGMTIDETRRQGERRRPARPRPRRSSSICTRRRRCSAGSPTGSAPASIPDGSSPTSSIATSTTRTCASRAATSARSIVRSARPKATCSASRRSSARSTRRSRSAAASCCCRAATTRTCR